MKESILMKMIAAVIHDRDAGYQFESVDLKEPKNDEVLMKVAACGLCHTDEFGRSLPLKGPLVKNLKVGDHVAFSYASCGHCKNCLSETAIL